MFLVKEMISRVSKDLTMQGVPFLIFLNKQDLPSKMTDEEIVAELNIVKLFENGGVYRIQPCSAKNGEGIWDGV